MRLQQFLAHAGVASRRAAEALIVGGRIRVNDTIASKPGSSVNPDMDAVEVKLPQKSWQSVHLPQRTVCYCLNKPPGYTSTVSDPHAAKTVLDLVPKNPPVVPIGRLDKDSSGMLLLTNDFRLVHALTHPSHHVPKTYSVACIFPARYNKSVLQQNLAKLANGIEIDGSITAPATIHITNTDWRSSLELHLEIVLYEGRNRQIRRMMQKIGLNVLKLSRVAIGMLHLDDLGIQEGSYSTLTSENLRKL